jgi:sigma-B regulation protein RsbU (phosphoserine phosphatase)
MPAGSQLADDGRSALNLPRLHLIARHGLFAGVPLRTLGPLVEHCELRTLEVGDVLLAPGQTNTSLYLLLAGRLKVHIDRIDSEEGFLIEPGECTGEISVVDCRPATAFVVADEPSQVLVVPEAALWEGFLAIPEIARNFMRLFANRLRARTEVIQLALEQQIRYEHLQKELAIAHDIQLDMVPRNLDFEPEIDIVARMIPAQHVGGDFYDAFPVSNQEYCVAIGDVSGKGVPAALFMVKTMTLLRTELLKDQPIEEALRTLNAMLCEENPTCMFATLIVGILDKLTGVFRYVNAGHDALVLGEGGVAYRSLPPPMGIPIGLEAGATYEIASLTLSKNDVLVLYTDGVTEAMSPDSQLFSFHRLMECLGQRPASSAHELADRIDRAVHQFAAGAPQSDDLTTMIIRYQGA